MNNHRSSGRSLNNGFPKVSSMPSIRRFRNNMSSTPKNPQRCYEMENLRKISSTASPFATKKNFTQISVSTIKTDDDDDDDDDESRDQLGEISQFKSQQFPVVVEKAPSMLSLRNRRDPQYQGNRTLKTARIVNKAGDRNVDSINLPEKSARFIKDIVHTLVEAQWRWVISVFILSYFGSWLLFAALNYVISLSHGDLEFDEETGQRLGEGREECIRGARDFTGFFLLSVESQVSTGYGEKYPTEECPESIFLLIVQLVIGVIIDATMVGIVYVKIIRPPKYASYKFGRNAVICQRDGKLCLIFRVADFKQSQSIDSKLRAYIFEEKITSEGERAGKIQQRLKLENNGRVFLIWPQTVCHYIDKDSPFYDMSARDLLQRKFEIVLSLTGISHHTGMTTQSRTSYLSSEILWGHRFVNLITYDSQHEVYVTDVDLLDDVEQVDTALCSAKRLEEIIHEVNEALETETIRNYLLNDDEHDDIDTDDDDEDDDKFDQHSEILTMRKIKR